MTTDDAQALRSLLETSDDPLWTPVVLSWIAAFDGWWQHERDEGRDPACAIALQALRRLGALGSDARRTALFLSYLPFNRWHASTPAGDRRWNPLEQSFREFVDACAPQRVVTFVAPEFEDRRFSDTTGWLWAMWRVQWVRRNSPDV